MFAVVCLQPKTSTERLKKVTLTSVAGVVVYDGRNLSIEHKQQQNVLMSTDLVISKSIDIFSNASKVWEVLIKPEMITQYFTGAETVTSWQIGSEITFTHIYEGKEFKNKGVILNFEPNKLLRYTYWTSFSNTEDKPENYTTISYDLTETGNKTQLHLTQTNFKNAEWYNALEIGWDQVLEKMKELAEGDS